MRQFSAVTFARVRLSSACSVVCRSRRAPSAACTVISTRGKNSRDGRTTSPVRERTSGSVRAKSALL